MIIVAGGVGGAGGQHFVRKGTIMALVIVDVKAGMSILAKAIALQVLPSCLTVRVVDGTPFSTQKLRYGPESLLGGAGQGSPATWLSSIRNTTRSDRVDPVLLGSIGTVIAFPNFPIYDS